MAKKYPQRKHTAATVVTVIEAVLFLGVALTIGASIGVNAAEEAGWIQPKRVEAPQKSEAVQMAGTDAPVSTDAPAEAFAPEGEQLLVPTPAPTPEPTPEPPVQDASAVALDPIDETQARREILEKDMERIEPEGWGQSSVVEQKGKHDNTARAVSDGKLDTSWQEGVDGHGLGEGIFLTLDDDEYVQYLELYLGNWRSDEWYEKNNVPAKLYIEYYDRELGEYQGAYAEFSYGKQAHWLKFSRPVPADELALFIEAIYKGSEYDDTCIAEVVIYGTDDLYDRD